MIFKAFFFFGAAVLVIAVAVIANQQQVTQSEFNAQCQQRGQVLVSKLTVLRGELDSFGGWASGLVVQAWLSGRFSTLPFTQTQFTQKISTNASAFPGVDAVVYFNYIASASDRAAWEQAHGLNITQITAVSGGTLVFQREPARPAYLPVANAFPPLLGQAPIGILGWDWFSFVNLTAVAEQCQFVALGVGKTITTAQPAITVALPILASSLQPNSTQACLANMVGLLLTDLPLAPLLNETAEETAVGPVQITLYDVTTSDPVFLGVAANRRYELVCSPAPNYVVDPSSSSGSSSSSTGTNASPTGPVNSGSQRQMLSTRQTVAIMSFPLLVSGVLLLRQAAADL